MPPTDTTTPVKEGGSTPALQPELGPGFGFVTPAYLCQGRNLAADTGSRPGALHVASLSKAGEMGESHRAALPLLGRSYAQFAHSSLTKQADTCCPLLPRVGLWSCWLSRTSGDGAETK